MAAKKWHMSRRNGAKGRSAGLALTAAFGQTAEIVGTVICGDSYFNEHTSEALPEILDMIKVAGADLLIAGPAFNAGRYGVACGTVAKAAQDELGIKTITGMYVENPGADMFAQDVYIISTRNSAAGMRDAVRKLVPLAQKLVSGEPIGASSEEGYLPRGIRVNLFEKDRGAKRAVEMLVRKLRGQDFTTEYPMPDFDRVPPQPARNISRAKVARSPRGRPFGNRPHRVLQRIALAARPENIMD